MPFLSCGEVIKFFSLCQVRKGSHRRRVFLSLGNEFILVIFDFARIASGQKHRERIEVDDNGKRGFQADPQSTIAAGDNLRLAVHCL